MRRKILIALLAFRHRRRVCRRLREPRSSTPSRLRSLGPPAAVRAACRRALHGSRASHVSQPGATKVASAPWRPARPTAGGPYGAVGRKRDRSVSGGAQHRLGAKWNTTLAISALVIDDDVRLFELLESFLQQNGVLVTHARDGREGLSKLESGAFDVVLLDVMMPGMDGLEVLRRASATRAASR